ncbi:MAG: DUF447 family protein [Planctomycetaceae bacterium]
MILEGLVTTLDAQDRLNVAPMGPIVGPEENALVLRPFQTAQTFRNLQSRPFGVFHIVDDVLLLAQAALDKLPAVPDTTAATEIPGRVLENCCHWMEFEIIACDATAERSQMLARVVQRGRRRDFVGFNRAKHAVLEATILATRLHLLPADDVQIELSRWAPAVAKTAGPQEQAAWDLVTRYIESWYRDRK